MTLSTTHPPGPPGPRDGPIALGAVLGSWNAPWNARGAPPPDSPAASSRRPPRTRPAGGEAPESDTLLVAGDASRPGFVKVPRAILLARGLSRDAKLLYAVLLAYAWQAGNCFPGADRLKEDLQCGINQVTRYLQELERTGLITVRRRGQGKTNVYTLHDLPSGPAEAAVGPDAMDRAGSEAHSVASEPVAAGRPETTQSHRNGDPRLTVHGQAHRISESRFPEPVSPEPPNRRPEYDSEEEDSAQHQQQRPTRPPVPPPTATRPAPTTTPDSAAPSGAAAAAPEELLARLLAQGIVEGVATRLLATHGTAVVRAQLAYAAYRPWTKHPAGALVQAIKEDWEPPPGWVDAQAQASVAARRAEEEGARAAAEEEARRRRAALPPEERVADRLAFWITGQRHKRREPDEAEIAAKRAELIAQLPPAAAAEPPASPRPPDRRGPAPAAGATAPPPSGRATTEVPQRPG